MSPAEPSPKSPSATSSLPSTPPQPSAPSQPAQQAPHPTPAPAQSQPPVDDSTSNFLALIVSILLKPSSTIEDENLRLASFKNAGLLATISSLILTLSTAIITIFNSVHATNYIYATKKTETVWKWENLENIDYFKLTVQPFLLALAVMAIVAAVYLGISRIFKRNNANYCRLLSVVAFAAIPIAIATLVSPLLGLLNITVAMLVKYALALYAGYIFYEGINSEVGLKSDKKIYFNCLSVIALAIALYVAARIFFENTMSSYSSSFDVSDFLKLLSF